MHSRTMVHIHKETSIPNHVRVLVQVLKGPQVPHAGKVEIPYLPCDLVIPREKEEF